jgi:ATP-grasp domain-containing protein
MKLILEQRRDWNEQLLSYATVYHHSEIFSLEKTEGLVIGTFKFCAEAKERGATVWSNDKDLTWSTYAPYIGNELLNSDYILLPGKELIRRKYEILGQFGVDCKIFVRPNIGFKTFDGQILDITEFNYFSGLIDNALTVISSPKKILGEWRFILTRDGAVLGYSLYRYQGDIVRFPSCPNGMEKYASEQVTKYPWNDPVVVMDIAQLPDMTFKVIECNGLSNSGLYAANIEKLVEFIKNI